MFLKQNYPKSLPVGYLWLTFQNSNHAPGQPSPFSPPISKTLPRSVTKVNLLKVDSSALSSQCR